MDTFNHLKSNFFALFLVLVIFALPAFSQPVLQAPAAGATNLEASFLISIRAFTGATTYDIELSRDGSFSGVSPNYQAQLNNASRAFTVSGLTYGATYFLRWRANNSAYGSTTVTIKAAPITYAQITEGTTFPNSSFYILPFKQHLVTTYDWQFDTTLSFNSAVLKSATTNAASSNGGFAFIPSQFIAGTHYYVRVRGNVSSQSLTGPYSTGSDIKSFYTTGATPPALLTPALGATGLEALFPITIGAVTGASTYDIELSHDGSYAGSYPDYQSRIGLNTKTLNVTRLDYGHTYFVRWKSNNSGYSSTTLTVKPSPQTYANIVDGVTMPASNTTIFPVLDDYVTSYDWEFDTVNTFDSGALISASTNAFSNSGAYTYNPSNFFGGKTYYVRVRGQVNSAYQTLVGDWATGADIKSFITSPSAAPVLIFPAMGATDLDASFTILIGTTPATSNYDIELSLDGSFTGVSPDYQAQLAGGTSFLVDNLQYGQTYTLRWRGNNTIYGTTTVTIKSSPSTYVTNIVDGEYLQVQTMDMIPLFQTGTVSYDWEFDTTNTFTSPALISANTLFSTNSGYYPYDANNFISGQLYYARVRVNTASITGPWSTGTDIKSFYSSLHLATISSPADASTINRIALKLECWVVGNATDYEIQYADNAGFVGATTVIPNRDWYSPGGWTPTGTLIVKSYDFVSGLTYQTTYYVRAHAYNANQASDWGPTLTFNTGNPIINITNIANGDSNLVTAKTVRYSAVTTADQYELQVDDDINFGSPQSVFSATTAAGYTGLSYYTVYYVKVRPRVGGVWQAFSPVIWFKTRKAPARIGLLDDDVVAAEVEVMPNPFTTNFSIQPASAGDVNISIVDVHGVEVYTFKGNAEGLAIGENLQDGIYIMKVVGADGMVSTQRVVKINK